ncbi:MAG: hypothetical protein B5M53_03860 [Candidatus Cloacimonas sp. 4484_209]|nr:MAG: hypothetical protein B5M53_03860 [Candidatus Cloacimonas sp. 4484_209]
MKCPLCKGRTHSHGLCDTCKIVTAQIQLILDEYYRGTISPDISDFVRELSFAFETDPRVRGYFNVAFEILGIAWLDSTDTIPKDDLDEITATRTPEKMVWEVIERAQIAYLDGENVHIGELSSKIIETRLAGLDLLSEEYKNAVTEVKGALSVALGKTFLTPKIWERYGRSRVILSILYWLTLHLQNHWEGNIPEEAEPIRIRGSLRNPLDYTFSRFNISDRQSKKVLWKLMGIETGQSKIIKDIIEKDFGVGKPVLVPILKDETVRYLERTRERLRERPREREIEK